jgi:hypothetical protein
LKENVLRIEDYCLRGKMHGMDNMERRCMTESKGGKKKIENK